MSAGDKKCLGKVIGSRARMDAERVLVSASNLLQARSEVVRTTASGSKCRRPLVSKRVQTGEI